MVLHTNHPIASEERTEAKINTMLLDLYRPRFELVFCHHPHGKEIVQMLCMGGNAPELVNLWFAEAEAYTAEAMMRPIRGATRHPGATGNLKFQIVKGDN